MDADLFPRGADSGQKFFYNLLKLGEIDTASSIEKKQQKTSPAFCARKAGFH